MRTVYQKLLLWLDCWFELVMAKRCTWTCFLSEVNKNIRDKKNWKNVNAHSCVVVCLGTKLSLPFRVFLFLRCSILLWAAERWSCDCRMRRQCVAKGTVKSFVLQGLDKVDESCAFVHDCSHADNAEHVNTPGVFLHMRFHSPEPVIAVAADVMFSASPSFLFLLKRYCTKRQGEFRRPGKNIHLTSTMNITE